MQMITYSPSKPVLKKNQKIIGCQRIPLDIVRSNKEGRHAKRKQGSNIHLEEYENGNDAIMEQECI